MRIAILVEGKTELVFRPLLLRYLQTILVGKMPHLHFFSHDGRIPKGDKLKRVVHRQLEDGFDVVIALTDVYTGDGDFQNASDAKKKMNAWVGPCDQFYPHVALHDFEAWLLPYWERIQALSGTRKKKPSSPEKINHDKPPSRLLKEIFASGKRKGRFSYNKTRDAQRILKGQDLGVAADSCPELKKFLERIITLSGGNSL